MVPVGPATLVTVDAEAVESTTPVVPIICITSRLRNLADTLGVQVKVVEPLGRVAVDSVKRFWLSVHEVIGVHVAEGEELARTEVRPDEALPVQTMTYVPAATVIAPEVVELPAVDPESTT